MSDQDESHLYQSMLDISALAPKRKVPKGVIGEHSADEMEHRRQTEHIWTLLLCDGFVQARHLPGNPPAGH